MSRPISFNLAAKMDATERKPGYRIFVYDVRSSASDTIGTIVATNGEVTEGITGPREFTQDVASIGVQEQGSDYIGGGIATSAISLNVNDPHGLFDPGLAILDPTGDGRWLRSGNVIRIQEGDEDVDVSEWPDTFTGAISGQAGLRFDRTLGKEVLTARALGREAAQMSAFFTSIDYALGTTYRFIAEDIATGDLAMDVNEIDWGAWGTAVTAHVSTTMADIEPLVAIAQLMFADGFMPRYNGEGKLVESQGNVTGGASKAYTSDRIFKSINRPFSDYEPPNSITVIGLAAELSKHLQDFQKLTTTTITTGYFAQNERFRIFFDPETEALMAEAPDFKVLDSVNGGMSDLGGGESATFLPSQDPDQVGFIGAEVEIDTGYAPWLAVALQAVAIGLAALGDIAPPFGGLTVSVGKILQAVATSASSMIMTKIGRGRYEVWGNPLEYLYATIPCTAEVLGTNSTNRINEVVENHLINSDSLCDQVALEMLQRAQAQGNVREIVMLTDLALEVDDIIETADLKRYLISGMSRTLRRGAEPISQIAAYEITPGVFP